MSAMKLYHVVAMIFAAVLILGSAQFARAQSAAPRASILSNATLTGYIEWIEEPPTGKVHFSYAILYVDADARSISNELPLRFRLDTTAISDGKHTIQVVYYDERGAVAETAPTPVIVANHTPGAPPQQSSNHPTATNHNKAVKPVLRTPAPGKGIAVFLHGQPLDFVLATYITNDRAMALLRPLTIAAGGTLQWQGTTGTTTIRQHTIRFQLHSAIAKIDGKAVVLSQPITLRQGRIFAPVSLWRDLLNGSAQYQAKPRSIYLGEIGLSSPAAK